MPVSRPSGNQSLDLETGVMTPPVSSLSKWRCCQLPDPVLRQTGAASR